MGNYDQILDTLQQFNDSEGDIEKFFNTMKYQIGFAHTIKIFP